jgi:undecaprenyl diphosphate synthase
MSELNHMPQHVAIIMDGNGRWARKRGLPRLVGHKAGGENIRPVVSAFASRRVKYLTLYAFSTENWTRPRIEVTGLFCLLASKIDKEIRAFNEDNVKLMHLGRLDRLPGRLKQKIEAAKELTKNNTGLTLCLAFDYGGRDEIVRAVKNIVDDRVPSEKIDNACFRHYLYTSGIPDPDLIIRTGGEMRLSNFLIWQAAYSEFYFTPVLWPDFGEEEVEKALLEYQQRQRRFGNV